MSSNGEASPQATCKATTKLGRPCRKQAVDRGLCVFHSGKLDMSAIGKRGGLARGRTKEEHASDQLEARAYAALDELLSSGSATARVAATRFALDRLTANSPAGLEAAKRALWLDQQAEREQELPAAREKLERLIEGRARVMAEEMHAGCVRRDLEAVKGRCPTRQGTPREPR